MKKQMTYPVGNSSPQAHSNKKRAYIMDKNKIIAFENPGDISDDPLTELQQPLTTSNNH